MAGLSCAWREDLDLERQGIVHFKFFNSLFVKMVIREQIQLSPQYIGLYTDSTTQDPPGQGPVQPAAGHPALAGGLDWMTHRGPFQP